MKSIIKLSFCIALSVNTSVWAEIVTDGSLGANASLTGAMTVPQSLGTTAGSNLFHSFSVFNINTGESASFTGDPALKNVISRVTGGTASNIDGLLQSTIGNANFYFINPAGVTFGANAQIDVPAAFHFSTANTLRFADGNQFNASNPTASVLSVADPSGFGFLNNQVGNINVQNSWLNFNQKNSVSLTANNVQLDNGWITSSEGSIHVIATGGVASEIPINAPAPNTLNGQVVLNNAWLDTSGNAGGKIHIQGGDVSVDNASWVTSTTNGTGGSGNITVKADRVTVANDGYIGADSYGQSNAGTVDITSNTLSIAGYNSAISSDAYAEGNGGNITINAQQTTVNGGSVYSHARSGSTGNAGTVTVNGNNLNLNNKAWIVTDTKAQGNAGNINVNVAALNITDDSYLSSSTFTSGNAGNVIVNTGSLKIDNQTGTGLAGIIARAEKNSTGKAGTINVQATGTVDVSNSGRINATTLSTGDAGSVLIKANALNIANKAWISADTRNPGTGNAGTVTIDTGSTTLDGGWISGDSYGVGNAGGVNIKTAILNVLNSGWISSDTYNTGNAGAITVDSDNVTINGGYVSSDTRSTGNAGNVTINGKTLTVLNNGWISSNTYSTGNAGNVTVNGDILRVLLNGWISSDTLGRGNAGAITVSSGNTELNGGWISSDTQNAGNAGDVTIKSGSLAMLNGGWISSDAKSGSTGNAGAITINSNTSNINGSWISSNTHSTGNAGSVFVKSNILNIFNSGWISSDTYNVGNAGDIFITADDMTLSKSGRISSDNIDGKGGDINLNAGQITLTEGGIVSTTTYGLGNAGTLNIQNANHIFINGLDEQNSWTQANGKQVTGQFSGFYLNTLGAGNGGNLLLTTNNLAMSNGGVISAIAADKKNTANTTAGSLLINANNINLSGGSAIATTTSSLANAGSIIINAKTAMSISGQFDRSLYPTVTNPRVSDYSAVLSNASRILDPSATQLGSGGSVIINTPNLALSNNGLLSVSTEGDKAAGNININTALLTLDNARVAATAEKGSSGTAGSVHVNASQAVTAVNNASINSSTFGSGKAGDVTVQTPTLLLDTGAEISALAGVGSSGETGVLKITTNTATLNNGGKISVQNDGIANNPSLIKPSDLVLDIPYLALNGGIITAATSGNVNAGNVIVKTQNPLALRANASINSNTSGSGSAGNVSVFAPVITLDNSSITAKTTATGNAGSVTVSADDRVAETNNASINSSTTAAGNAGNVTVTAPGISLDNASIKATAESGSTGMAGSVIVAATRYLNGTNNASINSSTFGSGKAGDVTVQTPTLLLDTGAEISALAGVGSSGETGVLKITTNSATLNNGGKISVQNDGIANNPSLIKPSDLVLDMPYLTLNGGIITAATSGNVNAGNVIVKTQNPLALRANASINSNTSGSGSAGNVSVFAPYITLDNSSISAEASSQSQGQTGNVTVTASQAVYLKNNANISLKNAANIDNPKTIKPSAVTVSAPDIDLKNSSITTESTGNVDAGNININFSHWLTLDPSFITTTANTGNGGDISITGGQLINLQNSGFLTSVSGANSNGGNIKVTADYLIMDTGVIQANAIGGSGGDIELKLNALIPSQNRLILGGKKVAWQPFQSGLNVIQAASENGVSGSINVTSPQFDISASISGLDSQQLVMPNIDNSPCQSSAMMDSSLSRAGQGGIPNNEAQYGFIPPAIINTKATSTPATPLAHLSGSSLPCKK
jgi:filamentous hemagglutinin family protein